MAARKVPQLNPTSREHLAERSRQGQLFALVDPYYMVPEKMNRADLNPKDTDPEFYEIIAWQKVTYEPPFLVRVDEEGLDWILNTLATERWGVFIVADTSLERLQLHFQKFVIARGPDKNPYFFKFHDASVLEVFFNTWTQRELEIFYGPVESFGISDLDTVEVTLWGYPVPVSSRRQPLPEECLITLRNEQLQASTGAIDKDLAKVISWHLRNHHPRVVQFLSKDVLERRVAYGIRRGRKYQLNTLSDLAGYVSLMFEIAPNFDQHPAFRRVLADPELPPDAKMQKLVDAISEKEWDEAARMYDRNFWNRALSDHDEL